MVLAFLLFGVTQTPDGPFKRPHPGIFMYTCYACSDSFTFTIKHC